MLNNLDWFGRMSFLTFLRDVGKFARVGTMLAKDSVSMRQRKLLEAELPKCLRILLDIDGSKEIWVGVL